MRSLYDKAVRELRLAKSDLERMRNEEKQAEDRPSPVMDERAPMQRAAAMAEPIVLDDARIEGDTIVATAPPELQDLGRGTATVVDVTDDGVVLELTAYGRLLQRYKEISDRIHELPCTYGNPSKEEKDLKKDRLTMRKALRSMAPLRSCWFCSGFSINNYDNPCREGALGIGAVPRDACASWGLATGSGYLTEDCTTAWAEYQAEQAAEASAASGSGVARNVTEEDCKGCMHEHLDDADECCGCYVDDEVPTNYEPAPEGPWWEGGPLDTVNGMPWHVAVAKCPEERFVELQPGRYEWNHLFVETTRPHRPKGPRSSPVVLHWLTLQEDVAIGVKDVSAEEKEVKVEKEDLKQYLTRRIAEEEAASAARRQVQLDLELQPVQLPDGIKEEKNVRRSRMYEHGKFVLRISEDDLAELWTMLPVGARTLVAKKLRLAPKEQLWPGEWDEEVEYLTEQLTRISRQVSNERAAAVMRGEA